MGAAAGREQGVMPMILVTGATGTIGSQVVRQLIEAGQKVRVMTRDATRAGRWAGVADVIEADLAKPETLPRALGGVEKAFLLSGGLELATLESNFVDRARSAGVALIVKLSAMVAPETILGRLHGAVERELAQSGIPWTVLRPTFFSSNALFWAETIRSQGAVYAPTGSGKQCPIDPADVAAVAVRALTASGHEGRAYELTGPEALSVAEQAATIAAVTGRPIRFVDVTPEAAKQGMVAGGFDPAFADAVLELYASVKAGLMGTPTPTFERVMGRRPRRFEAWVKQNAAAFR
jgi:uncharacterized protein YbjT (DUF2867 family)